MDSVQGGRRVLARVSEFQPSGDQFLCETKKSRKWKFIVENRNGLDVYYELYICGNKVIVSHCNDSGACTVKATYTIGSDVVQAFLCQFADPEAEDNANVSALCIVEEAFLHFYCSSGDSFTVPLAFQAGSVFPLKNGVLVQERKSNSMLTPQLYCLLHPADMLAPVTVNLPGSAGDCLELVWACPDPPLAVFVNIETRAYSIWSLKQLESMGTLQLIAPDGSTSHCTANLHSAAASHTPTVKFDPGLGIMSHQSSKESLHLNPPHSRTASPFVPSGGSGRTPESGRLGRLILPWSGASGQGVTRSEPLAAMLHHCHSRGPYQAPPQQRTSSPRLARIDYRTIPRCAPITFSPRLVGVKRRMSSVFSGGDHDVSLGETSFLDGMVAPAMEMNRVWVDEAIDEQTKDLDDRQFAKAFLYKDFSGKHYVCILTAGSLRLVEYTQTSHTVVFSNSFSLTCKDALPLEKLGVLVLLREGNELSLYCGQQAVCCVGFEYKCGVAKLISSVRCDVYMEMVSGQAVQAILPPLPTFTAVDMCLGALQCVLPHDIYNSLHSLWYVHAVKVSKETNLAGIQLLNTFCTFLLDACGVDVTEIEPVSGSSPIVSEKEDEDWCRLLGDLKKSCASTAYLVGLPPDEETVPPTSACRQLRVNVSSFLYKHLPVVFFSLHLVHEEMKLNCLLHGNFIVLAQLLVTLGTCLSCHSYLDYYYSAYPVLHCSMASLHTEHKSEMMEYLSSPCDVMLWLQNAFDSDQDPFPILSGVTRRTQDICIAFSIFGQLSQGHRDSSKIVKPFGLGSDTELKSAVSLYEKLSKEFSPMNAVVQFIAVQGFSPELLQSLPRGVEIPLREALHSCCNDPPTGWPTEAYHLLGRDDLARQKEVAKGRDPRLEPKATIRPSKQNTMEMVSDGMDHLMDDEILQMRFSQDQRIREVRRLLQSAKPCRINLKQRPEVSDHDFIEEQEQRLFLVCQRTMALPVARGMFTLGTLRPIVTEPLPVPPLTLKGQVPPRNTAVNLDHIDIPASMTDWPEFHNGVACGLVIDPRMKEVHSSWITYNQPVDKQLTNEHAGFLLALGLTGHLNNLDTRRIHSYLSKGHQLTSTGLLLGLAAAKRGTSDLEVTRTLSVHVQALLPIGSSELDIPPLVQTAAVVGIGLVYEGSAHRHMAEVLLGEIGRPAGPELENATNRESHALAAGIALGMVALGKADSAVGLLDLKIADTLFSYMTAGQLKRPLKLGKKEDLHSHLIMETSEVNTHVTAPGAILALGLIYMKSNNRSVAHWLDTPDSHFALQSIRPDFLTLRTISHGMILWDTVHPSVQWVESRIPQSVNKLAFQSYNDDEINSDSTPTDSKMICQAKVHITAGACMAIGLKFAGTGNQCAFECLVKYCKKFIALSTSSLADQAGKYAVEYCLDCCLLALSMVMAGTGNLTVLRLVRQLHGRLQGSEINFGSHMAVHMALGFLFLGGGRYSLSGNDRGIPSLLCSVFPMFPYHSSDNRYHLQALRHLYVVACEPRLLIPRDVHTLELCYVPAEIILTGEGSVVISRLLPCLLPPLDSVKEVRVSGDRYWPVRLPVEGDEDCIRTLLSAGGTLFIQKRKGYLSYRDDPKGHSSILHQYTVENSSEGFTVLPATGCRHPFGLSGTPSHPLFNQAELAAAHGLAVASLGISTQERSPFRFMDGRQVQTQPEVELVLRFYSSVPKRDSKNHAKSKPGSVTV